jgi:thiol-disulfide isomerase/thioredoxin
MKFALALSLLVASPVFAQQASESATDAPPPAPAKAVPDEPAAKPAAPVDPEAVKAAEKLLSESAKAYQDAKTLTDTITIDIVSSLGPPQKQEMVLVFGPDNSANITMPGMKFTALDGYLHIVRDDVGDKYVKLKLDGSLGEAMNDSIGFSPPQTVMRSGGDLEQQLVSWTLGSLDNARIVGHEMIKTEAGASLHQINLAGDAGTATMHINPESKLVEKVKMQVEPPNLPASTKFDLTMTLNPKVADALATAIAFDPGNRKAVDSLEGLDPTPIGLGETAHDFTLSTLGGESVTLSKLKGSVVILDFWATWCGPCKMALPKLQEFATWAESSGQPIKVYAVDVWERFPNNQNPTDEEKKAEVSKFWTSKGYTMPTLMDYKSEVVVKYGFQSIPTTVVIGPDGKIVKIHTGYAPDMVDKLKADVEEALKTKG